MRAIFITTLLALLFIGKTFACLNGESVLLKDGTFLYEDELGRVPFGHIFNSNEAFLKGIKQLDSLYTATDDLDYLSDKGVLLILLKRYNEAVKLYLKIEGIEPNRYSTASNLGTAYELLGENKKALHWIKRSVEIDPESHKKSEWIHVNILEAKIKGEAFYTTSFLLNTEFGSENKPVSKLSNSELYLLNDALFYQLNERVSFVKPKEKIVARLLFELGNLAFLAERYYDALGNYHQAKKYGFDDPLIETRIKEVVSITQKPKQTPKPSVVKTTHTYTTFLSQAAGTLIVVVLGLAVYVRKKKTKSKQI